LPRQSETGNSNLRIQKDILVTHRKNIESRNSRASLFLISALGLAVVADGSIAASDRRPTPGVKIIDSVTWPSGYGPNHAAINTRTNRIYIANLAGGSVSVVDGKTDQIIDTIAVGDSTVGTPGYTGPAASAIDEKTNTIYTINDNGILSVIDGKTDKVTASFTVDTNNATFGLFTEDIVRSSKNGMLFASNYSNQIDVVDPGLKKVLAVIPDDNANFLAINRRTNKIYAPQYWDATVWVINGDSYQVEAVIDGVGDPAVPDECYLPNSPVPCSNPSSGLDRAAVDESTNRIYVAGVNDGSLFTIDGNTNKVVKHQTVAPGQFDVTVNPFTSTLYTINFATADLSVFNTRSSRLLDTISIGSGFTPAGCYVDQNTCTDFGNGPSSVAVNPLTGRIYVVDYGDVFSSAPNGTLKVLIAGRTEGDKR